MTYLCALCTPIACNVGRAESSDTRSLDFRLSGAAVGPKTSGGCVKTEVAQATIRWGKP